MKHPLMMKASQSPRNEIVSPDVRDWRTFPNLSQGPLVKQILFEGAQLLFLQLGVDPGALFPVSFYHPRSVSEAAPGNPRVRRAQFERQGCIHPPP